jgi:hypothetical protein
MEPREQGRHSLIRARKAWEVGSPDDPRSLHSSPHMVQVRERIRINGKPISPELFTKHFWCLYNQLEEFKVLWLGTGEGPSPCGVRGSGPDWLLLCAGRQPCLHALLLPLPHTHGLPCLPPREGECLS